jgi:hypothetical protein
VRSFRRSPAGRLIGTSRDAAPLDAGTAARRPASPPKGGVGRRRELTVISVGFRALCVCLRQTTSPAGAHLDWPPCCCGWFGSRGLASVSFALLVPLELPAHEAGPVVTQRVSGCATVGGVFGRMR